MSAPRKTRKAGKQSLIMGLALTLTGLVEAVEDVAEGRSPLEACADAVENTRVRGRAIKKAAANAGREMRRRRKAAETP